MSADQTTRDIAAEMRAYAGSGDECPPWVQTMLLDGAAEIERLRAALEDIASVDPNAVGSGRRATEYDRMRWLAKRALRVGNPPATP